MISLSSDINIDIKQIYNLFKYSIEYQYIVNNKQQYPATSIYHGSFNNCHSISYMQINRFIIS